MSLNGDLYGLSMQSFLFLEKNKNPVDLCPLHVAYSFVALFSCVSPRSVIWTCHVRADILECIFHSRMIGQELMQANVFCSSLRLIVDNLLIEMVDLFLY